MTSSPASNRNACRASRPSGHPRLRSEPHSMVTFLCSTAAMHVSPQQTRSRLAEVLASAGFGRVALPKPAMRGDFVDVSQSLEGLQAEVEEDYGEKIVALRRDIHREPELGFDTEKTAEKVLAALDGLPLDIDTGVARNGIVATLQGGEGPTVALRADMDALPIEEET